MLDLMTGLFGWMPPVLAMISTGVVFIFFFITFCHLVSFILDLIPFLR